MEWELAVSFVEPGLRAELEDICFRNREGDWESSWELWANIGQGTELCEYGGRITGNLFRLGGELGALQLD